MMVVRVSTMPLKSTICKHKGGIDQDIPITHKVIFKNVFAFLYSRSLLINIM